MAIAVDLDGLGTGTTGTMANMITVDNQHLEDSPLLDVHKLNLAYLFRLVYIMLIIII